MVWICLLQLANDYIFLCVPLCPGVYGLPKCPGESSIWCNMIRKALNSGAYSSWVQKQYVLAPRDLSIWFFCHGAILNYDPSCLLWRTLRLCPSAWCRRSTGMIPWMTTCTRSTASSWLTSTKRGSVCPRGRAVKARLEEKDTCHGRNCRYINFVVAHLQAVNETYKKNLQRLERFVMVKFLQDSVVDPVDTEVTCACFKKKKKKAATQKCCWSVLNKVRNWLLPTSGLASSKVARPKRRRLCRRAFSTKRWEQFPVAFVNSMSVSATTVCELHDCTSCIESFKKKPWCTIMWLLQLVFLSYDSLPLHAFLIYHLMYLIQAIILHTKIEKRKSTLGCFRYWRQPPSPCRIAWVWLPWTRRASWFFWPQRAITSSSAGSGSMLTCCLTCAKTNQSHANDKWNAIDHINSRG